MTVAVVFDSAGTLLNMYRVAKDVSRQVLMPGIETTTLTFSCPDRVLIVLPVHSKHIITAPPATLLSTYLMDNQIGFGISWPPEDHDRGGDRGYAVHRYPYACR